MKVVVCPDRFKGTLSAAEAARHLARGVRAALPRATVICLPTSDGGAGLLEVLRLAGVVALVRRRVTGPLGERRLARLGIVAKRQTIIVEAAEAAGLTLTPPSARDPRRATTFGVGELVRHAAAMRPRTIVVGLGGTGTNDGGIGFARAIGVRFFDRAGREALGLLDGPSFLDASGIDRALRRVRIRVASDVTNPLTGPRGATRVFGPQKGVARALARELEAAMKRFGRLLASHCGRDVARVPGAGAAGGLGAALIAFVGAEVVSGAEWVAKTIGLDAAVRRADLVVTGEGRIDAQTLHGKTVLGVIRVAGRRGTPVLAIGGSIGPGAERLRRAGASIVAAALTAGGLASGDEIAAAAETSVRTWLERR